MGKNVWWGGLVLFLFLGLAAPVSAQIVPYQDGGQHDLGKILGGQRADIRTWPWTVAVAHAGVADAFRAHFCGGTLISGRWVVTAAHCLTDSAGNLKFRPGDLHVVTGRSNLRSEGGDRIPVSGLVVHPGYNPESNDSDLALLQLARDPAEGTIWSVLPVIQTNDPAGLTAAGNPSWVTGWGALGPQGPFPQDLYQAQIPLVSQTALILAYPPPFFSITGNMIGAGPGDGRVDTCQGDSGGPLMVRDGSGNYVLAGVTSWGLRCGTPGIYGVYVRLANYCGWIKGATGVGDCGPEHGGSGGGCTVGGENQGGEWLLLVMVLLLMAGRTFLKRQAAP
ncbi:serine protease [Desulfonatronum parangueonense]